MGMFRFEISQLVRVITHPAKPLGIIVERWAGKEMRDVYYEKIYSVSSCVTKQRESSLELSLKAMAPQAPVSPPSRRERSPRRYVP